MDVNSKIKGDHERRNHGQLYSPHQLDGGGLYISQVREYDRPSRGHRSACGEGRRHDKADLPDPTGAYDLVSILEAADDESATAFALAVCSLGNVRTTTMRAFDAAEMREIVAKAGG